MLFKIENLTVRKLIKKDNHLLTKWLSDPVVLKFYEGRDQPFDLEKVNNKFFGLEDNVTRCIIEFEQKEIGYIQFYPLDNQSKNDYGYTDEAIFGMDQFIGEAEYLNKGIGTLLVSSMVRFLIEYKNVDRIVMDPQIKNTRALSCYTKCGFEKVKKLPKHEFHEGQYQDCWLVEFHT